MATAEMTTPYVRPRGNIVRAARTDARRAQEQALRATCKDIVANFRTEYREAQHAMVEELSSMVSFGPSDVENYPSVRAGKAPTTQQIYEYLCRTVWYEAANQARRFAADGLQKTLDDLRRDAMAAVNAALEKAIQDVTPALKRSLQQIALKEWSRIAPDPTKRDRDTPMGSTMLADDSYARRQSAAREYCTRDAGRPRLTVPDQSIASLMRPGDVPDSAVVKDHGTFKATSTEDQAGRDFAFTQAR